MADEDLPATALPEELPHLVETRATGWDRGRLQSEARVRQAYGLREVAPRELASRSWVERAQELIREGWERLRRAFRKAPEPSDAWEEWARWILEQRREETPTISPVQEELQRTEARPWREGHERSQKPSVPPRPIRGPGDEGGRRR